MAKGSSTKVVGGIDMPHLKKADKKASGKKSGKKKK
jgi:hypothetical protein